MFNSFTAANLSRLNPTTELPFINTRYEKEHFTRLVPGCSQSMLEAEIKSNHFQHTAQKACSDFVLSYSNHGLCLTRNGGYLDAIFTASPHLSAFKRILRPKKFSKEVENSTNDPTKHHFTFFMDANSYKDMKRGIKWNSTKETKFSLSVHEPHDIPDVRGWNNNIMKAKAGQITTIGILQSQLKTEDAAREIEPTRRRCRFHDETDNLLSVKHYSKLNCLWDCNMKFAETICGCRPWDYHSSSQENETNQDTPIRICDFFGSSCFHMVLEDNFENNQCNEKCIPGCEEISFAFFINEKPIDPKNRICNLHEKPETMLELEIKKHIVSQFSEANQYEDMNYVAGTPPERRTMNLMRDILLNTNVSYFSDTEHAFKRDCQEKIKSDVAAVIVTMISPKFNRMLRTRKATIFEKLSAFGKLWLHFRLLINKKNIRQKYTIKTPYSNYYLYFRRKFWAVYWYELVKSAGVFLSDLDAD